MGSLGSDWATSASAKRNAVLEQLPNEWKIPGPIPSPEELPDATGRGIQQYLSPREIEITETDAIGIVEKTCSGQWTSLEVTKAFCHRATVAHQLVCLKKRGFRTDQELMTIMIGQLSSRNFLRCSYRDRSATRRLSCDSQEANWSPSWATCEFKGSIPRQRSRDNNGIRGLDRYV